ncbi:MAG: hypothetical protein ACXW2E_01705 [Nitrososphaeraceae archaeon]
MSNKTWEGLKWFSNICYVIGTILLISPTLASTAITPWCIFILGNSILFVNFVIQRNIPFICLSIFFFVWDSIIILSRLSGIEYLNFLFPFIQLLENNIP